MGNHGMPSEYPHDQSGTFATYPRAVELARAMQQKIDSILDAAVTIAQI